MDYRHKAATERRRNTYNARFGRPPTNAKDLHRPLIAADDLSEILAWREEWTVAQPDPAL